MKEYASGDCVEREIGDYIKKKEDENREKNENARTRARSYNKKAALIKNFPHEQEASCRSS